MTEARADSPRWARTRRFLKRIVLPLVVAAVGVTVLLVLTGIIAEPETLLVDIVRTILGK